MGRADVSDHRTPRGLQRQVGDAHRQVPAALEEHPAPRRDQRAEVRRRLHQPVGDEFHSPPDSGQLPGEPVGDLPDQALGQLRRGSRCGQQADDQLRLRFGVRNALRARALRHDPVYHHRGHLRQVGAPPTSPDRLAGRVVVPASPGVPDDGDMAKARDQVARHPDCLEPSPRYAFDIGAHGVWGGLVSPVRIPCPPTGRPPGGSPRWRPRVPRRPPPGPQPPRAASARGRRASRCGRIPPPGCAGHRSPPRA